MSLTRKCHNHRPSVDILRKRHSNTDKDRMIGKLEKTQRIPGQYSNPTHDNVSNNNEPATAESLPQLGNTNALQYYKIWVKALKLATDSFACHQKKAVLNGVK